jgi:hypothetical protein
LKDGFRVHLILPSHTLSVLLSFQFRRSRRSTNIQAEDVSKMLSDMLVLSANQMSLALTGELLNENNANGIPRLADMRVERGRCSVGMSLVIPEPLAEFIAGRSDVVVSVLALELVDLAFGVVGHCLVLSRFV